MVSRIRITRPLFALAALAGLAGGALMLMGAGGHGAPAAPGAIEKTAVSSHGEPSPPAAAPSPTPASGGEGHGAGEKPKGPTFKLAAPLGDYYDRTVLRSGARLPRFRYVFRDIHQTVLTNAAWTIILSCAVEFGAETGMAEIERESAVAVNDIRATLVTIPPDQLLTAGGKLALKEEIARAINRRLTTARVRQVYLTEFLITR